jgi:hypothetical protein
MTWGVIVRHNVIVVPKIASVYNQVTWFFHVYMSLIPDSESNLSIYKLFTNYTFFGRVF